MELARSVSVELHLPATGVSELLFHAAITPAGNPDTLRVTAPVNPPAVPTLNTTESAPPRTTSASLSPAVSVRPGASAATLPAR